MFDSENWILISFSDREMIDSFAAMQIQRLKDGKRFAAKNDPTFLKSDQSILAGYRGEWAVSRWLEIEMDFTTDAKQAMGGDLDFGIEVKATENPNGNLYCSRKTFEDYMKRSPRTPVVCAKVDAWPWVELPGWLYVNELQRYPFKRTDVRHNPGFLAHLSKLRPMADLHQLCEQWKIVCKNQR